MTLLTRKEAQPLIRAALREDAAASDLTSCAVIPSQARIRARIVAKAQGILAGGPVAVWTFQTVDRSLRCALKRREGAALAKGRTILTVEGNARSIFAAERTALNLLGHLSGIATLTHAFVQRVKPHPVKILDTRKTLPGLRLLEKYAVRAGGGQSHRSDLAEAILIKTNHLRTLGLNQVRPQSPPQCMADPPRRVAGTVHRPQLIQDAVRRARQVTPKRFVEVEVTNMREFRVALEARPDAILLDNWRLADIRRAVALRHLAPSTQHPAPLLEVSGGVTLANVRAIAKTGVDRISIGRLTHSAQALDVALEAVS